MTERRTIRFEDLGEPVQRLLKSLNNVSNEEMALLEYVSVKDMAKIYTDMSSDRQAAEIWAELRQSLKARREKADRRRAELEQRQEDLDRRQDEEKHAAEQEEAERLERERTEAERKKRREERRRRREAEARAAAEEEAAAEEARLAAEQEAREEEERLAAEEAERKRREAKKKRREARARELRDEQAELEAEKERSRKKGGSTQRTEWKDYVASHPLEFGDPSQKEIHQVKVEHESKAPPKPTAELMNRSYTPQCPSCSTKFARPPPEWDCPICLRRLKQRVKVWQPDDSTSACMICKDSVGIFSRHHCRSCGRVVCGKCSQAKAIIPTAGYSSTPVKACSDCVSMITKPTATPSAETRAA